MSKRLTFERMTYETSTQERIVIWLKHHSLLWLKELKHQFEAPPHWCLIDVWTRINDVSQLMFCQIDCWQSVWQINPVSHDFNNNLWGGDRVPPLTDLSVCLAHWQTDLWQDQQKIYKKTFLWTRLTPHWPTLTGNSCQSCQLSDRSVCLLTD
jgi:hypothetical protein